MVASPVAISLSSDDSLIYVGSDGDDTIVVLDSSGSELLTILGDVVEPESHLATALGDSLVAVTGFQCLCGDFDNDGDVDLVDFGQFQLCFTGPCTMTPCVPPLYPSPCARGDCDEDGDIDLVDLGAFQLAFTGPIE